MRDKVTQTVYDTIREHGSVKKGEHIVLGLSGGPDSVCLFDVLCGLAGEIGFTIEAVHVNHKLRPGDAEKDQAFVERVCAARGVRCSVITEDCAARAEEWGLTSEEAGRKIRYGAFDDAAKASGNRNAKICVAQNMNDQAETLLFRILRGTGTDGLAGMDYSRKSPAGFDVIRPLLDCERKDIERYCEERELHPRIDKTNLEPLYTRNKIRLGLIPYIKENFNENIIETLSRLALNAQEDRDFLAAEAEKVYAAALKDEKAGNIDFDRHLMKETGPAMRHRVIIMALGKLGLCQDITRTHLLAADDIICGSNASAVAEFHGGYSVMVSYDTVAGTAEGGGEVRETGARISVRVSEDRDDIPEHSQDMAVFDFDRIKEALGEPDAGPEIIEIRTRLPGDKIKPAGMKGRKKIQDMLVDMKMPAKERDSVIMACAGHEVLWIPGGGGSGKRGRYSGEYGISESTKAFLILELRVIL